MLGVDDVDDRVDQRQVGERLRIVAPVAPGLWVDLFCVQAQRACRGQETFAEPTRARKLPDLDERRDKPEGADGERALLALQPIVRLCGPIAEHESVLGEVV